MSRQKKQPLCEMIFVGETGTTEENSREARRGRRKVKKVKSGVMVKRAAKAKQMKRTASSKKEGNPQKFRPR
jgi:hypothetical protein